MYNGPEDDKDDDVDTEGNDSDGQEDSTIDDVDANDNQ